MLSVTYAECHLCWVSFMLSVIYAECYYAECMLTVIMQNDILLHFVMLNVIIFMSLLSVIMPECHYANCH
jgi:hypothetical protein